MPEVSARRQALIDMLFPQGLPCLWCPPLTHFQADGRIDATRIQCQLKALSPYARGVLVPGSTGEGWELSDSEVRELLAIVLQAAQELDLHVLIGVLRRHQTEMLAVIEGSVSWLCDRAGLSSVQAALQAHRVVGFTVCPPSGADLTQDQIRDSLAAILALGHPTALYQLPQVTGNEISPLSAAQLAATYPNFYLLKDTSGMDRIANSDVDLAGVCLLRGAEGQYARWLHTAGGPYGGFLLSSANGLSRELAAVIHHLATGDRGAADRYAYRIEQVVTGCFGIVGDYPAANPFTNANKILDHIMAYGPAARDHAPPYLRGGRQLPAAFVLQAYALAEQHGLVPERGYLSSHFMPGAALGRTAW